MKHLGDNLTGEGEGDDEQIEIDLSQVPADIEKIAFTVTIYDAEARRQNFGQVSNAFIRIVNSATGEEMIRYDLGEDFSIETAIVVGELYRNNGEWKFNAIGSGFRAAWRRFAVTSGLTRHKGDEKMSVSLQKGQKVSLSKDNAGLSKVLVGLGWDEVKQKGRILLQETGTH